MSVQINDVSSFVMAFCVIGVSTFKAIAIVLNCEELNTEENAYLTNNQHSKCLPQNQGMDGERNLRC